MEVLGRVSEEIGSSTRGVCKLFLLGDRIFLPDSSDFCVILMARSDLSFRDMRSSYFRAPFSMASLSDIDASSRLSVLAYPPIMVINSIQL